MARWRATCLWLALAGLAACWSPAPPKHPNIVLIVVDTLRADHLSGYGYRRDTTPTLDRLMRAGARFDAALSTSSWSAPAHTSLLTGLTPPRHGVFEWAQEPRSPHMGLADRLRKEGYATGIFSSHWVAYGFLPDLVEGFDEQILVRRHEEALLEAAARWASEQTRPAFLYVVLFTPHHPYDRYPGEYDETLFTDVPPGGERRLGFSRRQFAAEKGIPRAARLGDHDELGYYVNRYDRAVRHADVLIGGMLDRLQRAGVLDDAITVVTSDHGEMLGDRGALTHELYLYDSLIRVPLIVHAPGRVPPQEWQEPVQLTDVVPTILGLADLPLPRGLDGIDLSPYLRSATRPDEPRTLGASFLRFWFRRFMLRSSCYKLLYDQKAETEELYDLCRDPAESRNLLHDDLSPEAGRVLADLRREMSEFVGRHPDRVPPPPRTFPKQELVEGLRALGYVGGEDGDD